MQQAQLSIVLIATNITAEPFYSGIGRYSIFLFICQWNKLNVKTHNAK